MLPMLEVAFGRPHSSQTAKRLLNSLRHAPRALAAFRRGSPDESGFKSQGVAFAEEERGRGRTGPSGNQPGP